MDQDSEGFQERIDLPDPFEKKKMDFGLPDYESIKQLQITEKQLVILTETGKIFRQLYEERIQLQEIELPQSSQPIYNIVTNIFGKSQSYEPIEKFFLDKTGNHCLLQGKNEQTYYWHASENKIKIVLSKFNKDITSLAFDDAAISDQEVAFLFGTKSKEFFYGRIQRRKTNDIEFTCYQIDSLVTKSPIQKIFIYQLDYQKTNYTCVLVCDDQTFNYFYDEQPLPNLFKKYEKGSENLDEIPINPPGNIIIHMAKKIGCNRPHSFAYTTGSTIICLQLSSVNELPNDSFLKNFKFLQYAKTEEDSRKDVKDRFLIEERILKIGLTEFHYFLLHEDCLTVMSRLDQKVVTTFELGNMQGPVIDMIYDDSSSQRSFLIYSRKRILKIVINMEEEFACYDLIKQKDIKGAYELCKRTNLDCLPYVSGLYGDYLYQEGKYVTAAQVYSTSQKTFEEIMIKFLKNESLEQIEGIIEYLQIQAARLNNQKNQVQFKIISGLSLEYYNYKINELEKYLEVLIQEEAQKELEKQSDQHLKFKIEYRGNQLQVVYLDNLNEMRLRKQSGEDQTPMSQPSNKLSNDGQADQKRKASQNSITSKRIVRIQSKLKKIKDNYNSFLKNLNSQIDQEFVYEITQSHGRIDDCLQYAKEQNNYENVITHYVNEQNYKEAVSYLKVLAKKDSKRAIEIIYKFSYILLQKVPEEFISLVLNSIRDFQPSKLISGLMNIPGTFRKFGIQFLENCVYKQKSSDKIIHNLYLFFLANQIRPDENSQTQKVDEEAYQQLMDYLNKAEEQENQQIYGSLQNDDSEISLYSQKSSRNSQKQQNYILKFDLDFALHLFESKMITDAMVKTYALMNFYDLAVKLALDKNNISLAKEYASKHHNDDKKHKLWLKIAVHLIQTQQSQNVLQLTNDSNGYLKVEDLLPHFGEVHQIDLLKEQICSNLEDYNNEIENLKKEMDQLNEMSDSLKREINTYSHKSLQIKGEQDCSICHRNLLSQDHYFFGCFHGFHRNCYIQRMQSDIIAEQEKEQISDQGEKQLTSYSQKRVFDKIISINQYINKIQSDLKNKQEEEIKQMKLMLIDENQQQQSSSITKFFKGLGGALIGGAGKKEDEQQATIDINAFKKKLSSMANLKDMLQLFLSQEERDEYYKQVQIVDDFLSKECYFCGLSSVDRIHTFYPKNTKSSIDWAI
ncbi:vacuolar sorting protein, putative (macronuclear) [Tetrahymena thermophila SB210]|uniref:Vacuolar sorting protein, putative n=1 Tax=Tetrahymena thermophila (strain SB210) TaxID=312017 RepID=I7MKX7_TETTS|nr:vacuolar sorting protein, putative [Tetrahymena thermophila SB210]EAS00573.1 vacuolar sorting protein, putative [Tetrahymena thermophila SB210]|eukprot:XP_001020818.1 vacuolar sorting protein, putative [Tetrahymena thermophila SB210]